MNSENTATIVYELYREIRRKSPLTMGEYSELSVLSLLYRVGPHRVTAIAEHEGLTQPGVTTIIRRLVDKNWVRQTVDESDARATLAEITPVGIARLKDVEQMRTAQLEQILQQLSADDRQDLDDVGHVLQKLTTIIRTGAEVSIK